MPLDKSEPDFFAPLKLLLKLAIAGARPIAFRMAHHIRQLL